jgi:BTK motif
VILLLRYLNMPNCEEGVRKFLVDGPTLMYIGSPNEFNELEFNLPGVKTRILYDKLQEFKARGVPEDAFHGPHAVDVAGSPPSSSSRLSTYFVGAAEPTDVVPSFASSSNDYHPGPYRDGSWDCCASSDKKHAGCRSGAL